MACGFIGARLPVYGEMLQIIAPKQLGTIRSDALIGGKACERSRYGAFSTSQQAAGRLDILGPARGIECSSTMLLDHRFISSLWHLSPSGRSGCPSHSGLSGGQSRRT